MQNTLTLVSLHSARFVPHLAASGQLETTASNHDPMPAVECDHVSLMSFNSVRDGAPSTSTRVSTLTRYPPYQSPDTANIKVV